MINLTEGIDRDNVVKCHRPLRVEDPEGIPQLFVGEPPSDQTAFVAGKKGDSAMSERDRIVQLRGNGTEGPRRGLEGIYPEVGVMLVTRGARFGDLPSCSDRMAVSVDCRIIRDPSGGSYRDHVGSHSQIISGIISQQRETKQCIDYAWRFLQEHNGRYGKPVLIDFSCRSGRHRSVALSVIFGTLLQREGIPFRTIHLHSYKWRELRCGGRCEECRIPGLGPILKHIDRVIPAEQVDETTAVSRPSSSSRPSSTPEPSSSSIPGTSSDAAAFMPVIRQLTSTIDALTKQVADLQQQ